MPRKVDYASRFAFLREAAFALVCERGVNALSRRALAEQVGLSRARVDALLRADIPLASLAAQEVKERRRQGRWFLSSATPLEAATRLVCSLMADADGRIDEELVWIRLVTHPTAGRDLEAHLADREEQVTGIIRRALGALDLEEGPDEEGPDKKGPDKKGPDEEGVDEKPLSAEALRLRALTDGLTLATVLGRITPAEAVEAVGRHLGRLLTPPG